MGEYRPKELRHRFRCANSGFMKNGVVYGGAVACPRIIFLRDFGLQSPIDERSYKTFAIGHANEDVFEGMCKRSNLNYKKEDVTINNISPNVEFIMAVDFDVEGVVYELKSITSSRRYYDTFHGEKYKVENVAQLCSEMMYLERDSGILRYTNYLWHTEESYNIATIRKFCNQGLRSDSLEDAKKALQAVIDVPKEKWKAVPADHDFTVKICDDFSISINGVYSGFSLVDLMEHRQAVIDMFESGIVPTVVHAKAGWPPCKGCYFAAACDNMVPESHEDFLNKCLAIDKV